MSNASKEESRHSGDVAYTTVAVSCHPQCFRTEQRRAPFASAALTARDHENSHPSHRVTLLDGGTRVLDRAYWRSFAVAAGTVAPPRQCVAFARGRIASVVRDPAGGFGDPWRVTLDDGRNWPTHGDAVIDFPAASQPVILFMDVSGRIYDIRPDSDTPKH